MSINVVYMYIVYGVANKEAKGKLVGARERRTFGRSYYFDKVHNFFRNFLLIYTRT